jgi:hypothetical protein
MASLLRRGSLGEALDHACIAIQDVEIRALVTAMIHFEEQP